MKPNKIFTLVSSLLLSSWIIWGWSLPAQSQESQTEDLNQDISKWYLGPVFRLDELQSGTETDNSGSSGTMYYGLRFFHRMDDSFATGANILFSPEYSSFAINLDARWIWNLPLIEPYAGLELAYLTRSSGGLTLAPKLGFQFEWHEAPILLDVYLLTRYDLTAAIFDNAQSQNPFNFGFGTSIQYRL